MQSRKVKNTRRVRYSVRGGRDRDRTCDPYHVNVASWYPVRKRSLAVDHCRHVGRKRECVGLRGLKLRARHAALSNESSAKNGHRKSALAARSPGAWPRRAVKAPRRIAARRKRDGGYAPCPNPAVTLCRKVREQSGTVTPPDPVCPGIPPRRLHGPK